MDEPSSSSSSSSSFSSILVSLSPAIDRHNPIITDSRRLISSPTHPPPRVPTKPYQHKKKNSYTTSTTTTTNNNNSKQKIIPPEEKGGRAKKSVRKPDDEENVENSTTLWKSTWGFTRPGDFITPPGSTRYLLDENVLFENLSDVDPARKIFPVEKSKDEIVKVNASSYDTKSPSLAAHESTDKVVVLKVSLHCRGCERKMRKHLSRMEGVTSFNTDFGAKKVTVSGKITPLEVLSTISKVKNAQLWSPITLPSVL